LPGLRTGAVIRKRNAPARQNPLFLGRTAAPGRTLMCNLSRKPRKISFFALRLYAQFARDFAPHRKKPRFSRFLRGFRRGAVTLHQELNGITRKPLVRKKAKSQGFTHGSLSLTRRQPLKRGTEDGPQDGKKSEEGAGS
jgi:hypothetical protein